MEFPQKYVHTVTRDELTDRQNAAKKVQGLVITVQDVQSDGLVVIETEVLDETCLKVYNTNLRRNGGHPMGNTV